MFRTVNAPGTHYFIVETLFLVPMK